MLDKVKLAYHDATKTDIDLKIHPKKSLPANSAGGIDLCNAKESIIVSPQLKDYYSKLMTSGFFIRYLFRFPTLLKPG